MFRIIFYSKMWCVGVFVLLSSCVGSKTSSVVTLNTTVGVISGISDRYVSFLGIPYATVNESDPYGPAIPRQHFENFFEAHNFTMCPQIVNGSTAGELQCLTVNVFTGVNPRPGKYHAVMVFIHGGKFVAGDGNTWYPRWLIEQDLVIATINYRLGAYGFLCVPNTNYTNQGIKDQELALKWIKNNIEHFGGDSERILLFGHSAGAASVDIHMLYNNEDKLFRRAIIQGGSAGTPLMITTDTTSQAILDEIGFRSGSSPELNIYSGIEKTRNDNFGPCIDGTYITKTPKVKSLENMKIIVGLTDLEMFFLLGKKNQTYFENFDFASALSAAFSKVANVKDTVERIKSEYDINKNLSNIIDFMSDFGFMEPMERSIQYYLDKGATVRRYLFSYMGGRNYMKNRENLPIDETTHGDELGYIFEQETSEVVGEDINVVHMMLSMWTTFAKYGYWPEPSSLLPRWDPTTVANREYLHILNSSATKMSSNPDTHKKLWDSIYDQNYQYLKTIDLRPYRFDYVLLVVCVSICVAMLMIALGAYRYHRHRHQRWDPYNVRCCTL